jgi:L-alanine-DL-glutamate epimerase-like enolase superfamily enzyme
MTVSIIKSGWLSRGRQGKLSATIEDTMMGLTRRDWIKLTGAATLWTMTPKTLMRGSEEKRWMSEDEQPLFNLPGQFKDPVKIESIQLLQNGKNYFIRTRSTEGAVGVIQTKQIEEFIPIFRDLVAPYFIGRDARDLETLIDGVFVQNYKLAGLAFWCPVAYVEQSLLDMLGRIARKPVGALLGGVIRSEIPVYLSGSDRVLKAEEEVAVYERGISETGAHAVKFKIGGRMSYNLDPYPGRTETLVKRARQRLGDNTILYADANGSYNAAKAIEVGHMLEDLKYEFFEEPCPFEELSETQQVAQALKIKIAFGEVHSSLWLFRWMLQHGVMDIVQPDINYNGGMIRAKRVAKLAQSLGKTIVPHNTQTGASSVNILQFASCTRNIGPYMEYPWRKTQQSQSWYKPDFVIKDGRLRVPTGPGMGIEIDPDFLAQAKVVSTIS